MTTKLNHPDDPKNVIEFADDRAELMKLNGWVEPEPKKSGDK